MPFVSLPDRARFDDARLTRTAVFDSPQLVCDVYALRPGQEQQPHAHDGQAKFYYVIEGEGEFTLGTERRLCGPGWLVASDCGQVHGVANRSTSDLVLLVGIAPNPNLRSQTHD